jgi:Flp pilus assembly protein TadG
MAPLKRLGHQIMRRCLRGARGQTLAEFAIVAPLFFLTIFGIVDFSRMVQTYVTMQHSAREGARYGVTGRTDCNAATPTRLNCINYVVHSQAGNLANQATALTISVQSWPFQAGGTFGTPVANSAGQQCDAIEVKVQYDYHPMTPIINKIIGTVPLHATERLVNEPYGPCG